MAYWVLQGDPARYRMLEAALEFSETTWTTPRYGDKIAIGDEVVFWLSGRKAGAYAFGEVKVPAKDMQENPGLLRFWSVPPGPDETQLRIVVTQSRLLLLYPVLRTTALADPILKEMLVVRQPAGTVFPLEDREFIRLRELADDRPENWSREELILALDLYLDVQAGRIENRAAARRRLGRLCDREDDAFEYRYSNYKYLDQGRGLENAGADAKAIWGEFAARRDEVKPLAQSILQRLLDGGGIDRQRAKRRYWKIAPGTQAKAWPSMRDESLIAVGFGGSPLTHVLSSEKLAFASAVKEVDPKASRSKVDQLWDFSRELQPGDIIVANKGQSFIVGRGEVTGAYVHKPERGDLSHTRAVRWFDTERRAIPDQGTRWRDTVVEMSEADYERLFGGLTVTSGAAVSGIYSFLNERGLRFPAELVTTYLVSLKTKPFVILSGISGTGKTKLAQAVAEWAGVEEQVVDVTEPAPTGQEKGAGWLYQLQPYNFDYRRIRIAREYEPLFELPDQPVDVHVRFRGEIFSCRMGPVRPKGRLMHEIRLSSDCVERLAKDLKPSDFVLITVGRGDTDQQVVAIEPAKAKRLQRVERVRRYEFVSVRPDWLDGKEVLGFYNLLTEEYVARPFVRLMLRAHRDPEKPYFAILDEMNLARVEHYFADLLSGTESRRLGPGGDAVEQEPLRLHDASQCLPLDEPDGWERPRQCASCRGSDEEIQACPLWFDGVQLAPPRLRVPLNLHVTGTVNIDETTHQFSPKVLDRANVIEFNQVDLLAPSPESPEALVLKDGHIDLGRASVATLSDLEEVSPEVRESLAALNAVLAPFNLHFGYRVANEIALYVKNVIVYVGKGSVRGALDLQVLQKVLPKLHGSKQRLQLPLWKLLIFTISAGQQHLEYREEDFRRIEAALASGEPVRVTEDASSVEPHMPRSARKLARMLRTLREQGFVSFIE